MKLSEILRAGKARIVELGWCQGDEDSIFNRTGCCASTALLDGKQMGQKAWNGARDAISLLKKAGGLPEDQGLQYWNDHPGRTVEDVYALYDKAIAAAEAQEQAT